MKRNWIFIAIAAFSLMSGCTLSETAEDSASRLSHTVMQEEQTVTGTVTYVVDGDTFDVKLSNGEEERVRMTLVDTPETKHPRLGVQPFGQEAAAYTKEKLSNKEVLLELDVQERDQYGRLLAYVWLQDELVNEKLINKGLARMAVFPPNTKYVDRFTAVQQKAQQEGNGIWSIENYVTDRGYNSEAAEKRPAARESDCQIKGNISSSGEKIYHVPRGHSYEQTNP